MRIPLPPPWVLLSLLLGFSKHVQDVKEIGSLGWMLMRGRGEDAKCQLCDKIVGVVLKSAELDDMSEGGGVDCNSICFRVGKCVSQCQKITSAMANSTGFPCIAAGLCPAVDEFGEVNCEFSYKTMSCSPANACECARLPETRHTAAPACVPRPSPRLLLALSRSLSRARAAASLPQTNFQSASCDRA